MVARRRRDRLKTSQRTTIALVALLTLVVLGCAGAGIAVSGALSAVGRDLPTLDLAAHQPITENTYIFDGSARPRLLAVLRGDESRVIVPSGQISPLLKQAVVAIEDKRYYEHRGVDYAAIARAFFADVAAGGTVQGGSTITQQFIKNAYLPSEDKTEQTFSRKVREAVLAYQLEKQWPKDKILSNYLNTIYFGQGAYGIEMAARTYFGTSARRLTLAQSALLAGVIKDPSTDNPFVRPETARQRRQLVLDAMVEQGYATARQAAAAAAAPLPRRPHGIPKSHIAPYFVEYVISQLVQEFGAATAFGGGLRVYTTLDRRTQNAANRAARAIFARRSDPAVSIVAMDPRDGEIEAMVGGREFRRQQFNLAVQARRQPGSAFKPFALVTAIREDNLSPASRFYSEPKSISMGPGAKPWTVSTYSGTYAGPITLAEATVQSDNTVYADLAMMVGAENIANVAHEMGIASTIGTNPSIVLGGLEQGVSPLDMTAAYATLAADGERATGTMLAGGQPGPIAIRRVTDAGGEVLVRNTVVRQRVLEPWQARLTTSILRQVIQRGTGTAANIGRPCAGKTGTTSDYADAWFCGYTPSLTATVWVGYPARQRSLYVRGIHVAGGTFPAMIWRAFMSRALAGTPARDFPAFSLPRTKGAIVCARSGQLATRWCPERIPCFYFFGRTPQQSCGLHGPKPVTVPDLGGMDWRRAQAVLTDLDLEAEVEWVPGDPPAANLVLGQDPSPGEKLLEGGTVTLRVGSGPLMVVPNLIGLYREAATDLVGQSGLAVAIEYTSAGAAGTVVEQQPAAGETAQGTVTITVAGSDTTVRVPKVVGMTVEEAGATLADAGLGSRVDTQTDPAARVGGQDPGAGSKVQMGAVVALTPK